MSLGCVKALVDSERILTQLRSEGYIISGSYGDADLVVVNTCGFIHAAVDESLEAIGEALSENGRVIVTRCLGARGDVVRAAYPRAISARHLRGRIGQTLTVLVDEVNAAGAVARSTADVREIDGVVIIEDGAHLQVGEFAQVTVHAAGEHDLHARLAQ